MRDKYYFPFVPDAKVNYLFLFALWDRAEYNPPRRCYDTVRYSSITELANELKFPVSTVRKYLNDERYKDFFSVDKKEKVITLMSNAKELKTFVQLTSKQVQLLKQQKDNMLCKYVIYLTYYCGLAKKFGKPQDFTAKQFLAACGYSTRSNATLDKVSSFNSLLVKEKIISISTKRDDLGHQRNIYTLL